jgi:tRNA A37 threonylcarbamoyladenosine biosynthesis protein TsaE
MDAYRLSGESDFFETGGMDMLGLPGSFCVIEWSERLPGLVKESSDKIDITAVEGGTRIMKVSGQWLEELFQ